MDKQISVSVLDVLVWYQSKSEAYRNQTLLEDAVKDFEGSITKKEKLRKEKVLNSLDEISLIVVQTVCLL